MKKSGASGNTESNPGNNGTHGGRYKNPFEPPSAAKRVEEEVESHKVIIEEEKGSSYSPLKTIIPPSKDIDINQKYSILNRPSSSTKPNNVPAPKTATKKKAQEPISAKEDTIEGWEVESYSHNDPLIDKINKNLEALENSLDISDHNEITSTREGASSKSLLKNRTDEEEEEEEVELVYKEDLGCYYDPKTNQYFDIKP